MPSPVTDKLCSPSQGPVVGAPYKHRQLFPPSPYKRLSRSGLLAVGIPSQKKGMGVTEPSLEVLAVLFYTSWPFAWNSALAALDLVVWSCQSVLSMEVSCVLEVIIRPG